MRFWLIFSRNIAIYILQYFNSSLIKIVQLNKDLQAELNTNLNPGSNKNRCTSLLDQIKNFESYSVRHVLTFFKSNLLSFQTTI